MTSAPPSNGDGLRRAVEIMDVLRSPGGCPWDADQTHESLTRYLVEECYEVLEAIETGDSALLREELGDLLLQVIFHARLAQELPPGESFGIDEVAGDLTDKLIRRHPHVFAPEGAGDGLSAEGAALDEVWEARKIVEKGRTSALEGVPIAQPAPALAAKLIARARRAGVAVPAPVVLDPHSADERIGVALFALVDDAVSAGVDPEGALRRVTMRYRSAIEGRENPPGSTGGTTGRAATD